MDLSWGGIHLSMFLHESRNSENVPVLLEISQNLNELLLKCKCGAGSQDKGPIFSFHYFEEQKPKGIRVESKG